MSRVVKKYDLKESELNALVVYQFLKGFRTLEMKVKEIFKEAITRDSLDKNVHSKIWFYIGSIKSNCVFPNFLEETREQMKIKYSESTFKNTFTFKQIIKFDLKESIVDRFKIKVQSLNNKTVQHDFHTCCTKLISMRNVLSHEIEKENFKDRDIIEKLNIQKIEERNLDWLKGIDIINLNDASVSIVSNYITIEELVKMLDDR